MKKLIPLFLLLLPAIASVTAQTRVMPNRPYLMLDSRSGYITINEFTSGFGLAGTTTPYSKMYYGFTTTHGYQVDRHLVIGGGTGLSVYQEGVLIPLFADLRYRYRISTMTLYLFGDGGFLIDPSDVNGGTRMFLNVGPGIRMAASRSLAFNISPALLIQMGPTSRASFVNFKIGVTYKPG